MTFDLPVALYVSYAVLWVLTLVQATVLVGVVRIVAHLQTQRANSSPGLRGEAPVFTATDLTGRQVDSKRFAGQLAVLLFASPTCSACSDSIEDIKTLHRRGFDNLVVVCQGAREDCARLADKHSLGMPVVHDHDLGLSTLYNATALPMVYVIDTDNQIQAYGRLPRERLEAIVEGAPVVAPQGAS